MLRMLTVLTFPMDTIQHLGRSFDLDEFLSFYECFNKYYECILVILKGEKAMSPISSGHAVDELLVENDSRLLSRETSVCH
jgi:hypothetical protein